YWRLLRAAPRPPASPRPPYTALFRSFATSDLSVDFCDARQGGGAYGKTASSQPFTVVLFCPHVLSWLSPDSVDKLPAVIREPPPDRKSTRLNSSHVSNSYAVFCLIKH